MTKTVLARNQCLLFGYDCRSLGTSGYMYIIPLRSKLLFPYMNSGSYSDDYEFLDHFIEMLAKKNRKSTFLGK